MNIENILKYAGLNEKYVCKEPDFYFWDKTKYDKLFDSLTPEKLSAMASGILGSGAGMQL